MKTDVEETLRAVRSATIAGDYTQLSNLLHILEKNEAMLGAADLECLKRIKVEAGRTADCLDAAVSGVRAARRRMADILSAAQGLTTYDRIGGKATLPASPSPGRRV